jgi:hypothetical protein
VSKAPVPFGPVSRKSAPVPVVVAVSTTSGAAGSSVVLSAPVCTPNTMFAPGGTVAFQSNSLQAGTVPGWAVHEAVKSWVKVAGGKPVSMTAGGGGVALSGDTHEVRSKNRNSSAFSCDESVPWRQASGNWLVLNAVQ